MKTPQKENGYTAIANEVMDQVYKAPLSGIELRVCLFVIRKTWGWNKKEDMISLSQIEESVGIDRKNAAQAIRKLVTKKLLVKREGKVNTLQFNKNYSEWVVTKRQLGSYQKTTTLVTKRPLELVTKKQPTKESIKTNLTKEITPNGVRRNADIDEASKYFLQVMAIPKEDCTQRESRMYWFNLLRESKRGLEGVKWLIDLAKQDEFYAHNITSSKDLYYKRIKLLARKRGTAPTIAVMNEGGSHEKTMEARYRDREFLLN